MINGSWSKALCPVSDLKDTNKCNVELAYILLLC